MQQGFEFSTPFAFGIIRQNLLSGVLWEQYQTQVFGTCTR